MTTSAAHFATASTRECYHIDSYQFPVASSQ